MAFGYGNTSLLRGVIVPCKDLARWVHSALCEISALNSVVGSLGVHSVL
jgi:hypothetical protein